MASARIGCSGAPNRQRRRRRMIRQVVDVFVSTRRDADAAERFFEQAIGATSVRPVEVTTDRASVYPAVLEARLPVAWHRTDQCRSFSLPRAGQMQHCRKHHPHAVRILARAWLRVIWACWHHNTVYDPAKHGAEKRPAA